jgi:hypothetical protein
MAGEPEEEGADKAKEQQPKNAQATTPADQPKLKQPLGPNNWSFPLDELLKGADGVNQAQKAAPVAPSNEQRQPETQAAAAAKQQEEQVAPQNRPRSQSAPEKVKQPEAATQTTNTQSQTQSAPQKFVQPQVDYSGNFMAKGEAQKQATSASQHQAQANSNIKTAAETSKKPGSSMLTNLGATAGLAVVALVVGGGFPVGVALAGAVIAGGLAKTGYDSYRRSQLKKEQKNNKTPEFTPPNVDYSKATELMNRSQTKQVEKEFTPPNVDYSKATELMNRSQAKQAEKEFIPPKVDYSKATELMNQTQAKQAEKEFIPPKVDYSKANKLMEQAAQSAQSPASAGQEPGSTSQLNTQFRPKPPAGQEPGSASQLNTQFRTRASAPGTTPPEVNNQAQAKPQGTKGGQSQRENSVKEVSPQSPHFEIDKKPGVNSPSPTPVNPKLALNTSKSTGNISK